MSEKLVTYSIQDQVAYIGLNDQKRLNVLSKQLVDDLNEVLDTAENNAEVFVVIVYGHGRAFCVGGDLKEFIGVKSEPEEDFIKAWEHISLCKLPVIAAVHGYVLGGGCELMMMTDYVIAAEQTQFGQPELKLGFIPGCGATQRLPKRIGYGNAFHLMASGKQISVDTAKSLQLVDEVVEEGSLLTSAHKQALTWIGQGRTELIQLKCAMKGNHSLERKLFYEMMSHAKAQQCIGQFLKKR